MSTPTSRRSVSPNLASSRRQSLKQWDEAACQLAEEGQLLWLVGQGLHLALTATELTPQEAPTPPMDALRDWANRTVGSLGTVRREAVLRGYERVQVALPATVPCRSVRAPRDTAGTAADSAVMPVVWVASQSVRGPWVTLAVGADLQGRKKALMLLEGSTSDPVVVRKVLQGLADLISCSAGLLLVTDGSRTLDDGIANLGETAVTVAHCRRCLREDVLAHVPHEGRQALSESLDGAWRQPVEAAEVALRLLVSSLRRSHPGAAERLERSVGASLQVAALGVRSPLREHLEAAGVVRTAIDKALEWGQSTAAGVAAVEAGLPGWQRRTRRLMGYAALPELVQALQEKRGAM